MSDLHIELYKKYRPIVWRGLIGQEKISKSLQTALKNNKIPTAYLFAGPRGCGKTSAAFLLAKSINCLNPKIETQDPCNKCDVCLSIDKGTQIGVTYLSAAQKSGVDDIRELVQQARLSVPVKRQVIIIDEIHNLKQGKGFEALLIPLEEKTMPALFIFCTTEIEKVPETILSRVQSRKFSLVPNEQMFDYLQRIKKREELEISDEALQDAIRLGRGSVRDTLTALEGIGESGESSASYGDKIINGFSNYSASEILSALSEAANSGVSLRDLGEQTFEDFRNLLLFASKVEAELVGNLPIENPTEVVKKLYGIKGITVILEEVGNALTQIIIGGDQRICLEIGLVKALSKLNRIKSASLR